MNAVAEEGRYNRIVGRGQAGPALYPYPWLEMPATGEAFNIPGSIECPAAGAGDTLVNSFLCPPGYEGVVWGVMHSYIETGNTFEEGSGNILWRLRIAGYYPRGWGSVPFRMGNTAGLWMLPSPIRFRGNELVEQFVEVPAGSPVGTGPGNYVLGVISGHIWPVERNR